MTRRWVVNASPLILLGKIGRVSLLKALSDELLLPETVVSEVGIRSGGERVLEELVSLAGVEVTPSRGVPPEVEAWDLGPGESQVLTLALLRQDSRAVLDDLEARRCAQSLGVAVIGTLGVVLRAKRRGVIASGRGLIEELRRAGMYVSEALGESALKHLGE